jgi:hypothetical protein
MSRRWRHLAARWPPRAPLRRLTSRSASPPTPLLPLSLHRHSRASRAALLRHRLHARSPALPVLATTVHHRCHHLPPSSASPSRSPCSHKLPVVRPPSTGIARRSMAEHAGDFCSVGSSSPPHLLFFLCTYLARLSSPVLEHPSRDHLLAKNGWPATTRATAPPWTAVTGLLSSSGHRACVIEFAGLRWSSG